LRSIIRCQRGAADLATSELFCTFADPARNTATREEETSLGAQILVRLEHQKQVEHCDTTPGIDRLRVNALEEGRKVAPVAPAPFPTPANEPAKAAPTTETNDEERAKAERL